MFKNKKSTDFAAHVESLTANKATSLTSSVKDINAGAKAPESFAATSADEHRGYLMKFNAKDGYGFVKGEDGVDYFFRIENFDGKGELPAPGRYVVFTVSKKARQMGKAPKIAAMRFDEAKAGEAENQTEEDDTRTRCPYCGKMMVPRVVINYGIPIKSICPFCFGTIHATSFQDSPLITKSGMCKILLLGLIIAAILNVGNFLNSSTFRSFLSDELDRELKTNQTFHDEYFSKTKPDFWVRLRNEPNICSKVNVSPLTCWELKKFGGS